MADEKNQPTPTPEHHHEHASDWQRFVEGAKKLWDDHGRNILLVVLAVALVLTGYNWYRQNQLIQHEQAWSGLAEASTPESLEALAAETDSPVVTAIAKLRAADLLLAEAGRAQRGEVEVVEGATPRDPQDMISNAGRLYGDVVESKAAHELIRLNARVGLAAVAEAEGRYDQARELWSQVAEAAGSRYDTIAAQASERREMLALLEHPIPFRDTPTVELDPGDSIAPTDDTTLPAVNPLEGFQMPDLDLDTEDEEADPLIPSEEDAGNPDDVDTSPLD